MQHENRRLSTKEGISWRVAGPNLLQNGHLTIDQLYETAIQRGLFPALSQPPPLSEEEIAETRRIFNRLVGCVISAFGNPTIKLSAAQLCRIVQSMCTGNMNLFDAATYQALLVAVVKSAAVNLSSTELRQASSAATAALLYLHTVDYKTALGTRQRTTTYPPKHPDHLLTCGSKITETTLDCIIKLLDSSTTQEDTTTELSCLHALMQLLCHRKFPLLNAPPPAHSSSSSTSSSFAVSNHAQPLLDRSRAIGVVNALWVSICAFQRQQTFGGTRKDGRLQSGDSSGWSGISGGEFSDCDPFDGKKLGHHREAEELGSLPQNPRKSRLLATFCLRRLLSTSVRLCQDVWSSLMPEPPDSSSSSSHGAPLHSGHPQLDLITLIFKEPDYRLRQIFIKIFAGLLINTKQRFSIAEELSSFHSSSFIPYSVRLAAEVRTLHRRVVWALLSEKSAYHQMALLKAINSLVTITPYHRLRPGLLTSVLPTLNNFLIRSLPAKEAIKTSQFQGIVLAIWCSVLSKPKSLEVCELLTKKPSISAPPTVPDNFSTKGDSNPLNNLISQKVAHNQSICWLVELCLHLVHPRVSGIAQTRDVAASSPGEPMPKVLRLQALSTLATCVANYYDYLEPSWRLVRETIRLCLQIDTEEDRALRSNVLRFCDTILIHHFETTISSQSQPSRSGLGDKDGGIRSTLGWWAVTISIVLDNAKVIHRITLFNHWPLPTNM